MVTDFFFQGNKPIGKLKLDLGMLAKSDGASLLEFSFEKKKNYTPLLHVMKYCYYFIDWN